MVLVPGQNMWKTLRGGLFGIFGVMTYLVGPVLLTLAYLLASGYRVTLFAGKVALMSVLCAGVPVIFSNVTLNDANPWQIIKMLFARGRPTSGKAASGAPRSAARCWHCLAARHPTSSCCWCSCWG